MRFNPLVAAVAGIMVIGSIPALVKHNGYGGGEGRESQRQQSHAAAPAPLVNSPTTSADSGGTPCPETDQTKFDCNTVSAIANVRQAEAAERFNGLAILEIMVGLFTAFVAGLAARFARDAAEAATRSFKAFVAAEDAHLVLDFEQGPVGQWTDEEGVTKVNYSFRITVSNVGRSAARLQQYIFSNCEGSVARSFGETLKPDASTQLLDNFLFIMASDRKADVRISYATALHPLTHFDVTVGMDLSGRLNATAYVTSSRIGRPKAK